MKKPHAPRPTLDLATQTVRLLTPADLRQIAGGTPRYTVVCTK